MTLNLCPYCGGKFRLSKKICAILEKIPHKCYVEPFVGAGNIILNKKLVKCEIINDNSQMLTSIYEAIRENFDEFVEYVDKMEYSEDLYNTCRHVELNNLEPKWKTAAKHWFKLNASYTGQHPTFGWSNFGTCNLSKKFYAKIPKLRPILDRLQSVTITNKDALHLIPICDKPNVLLYCDPPYETESKFQAFDHIDHNKLEGVFLNLQSASLVFSHYKCERYDSKFKSVEYKSEIRSGAMSSQNKDLNNFEVIESLYFNEKAWNAVYDSLHPKSNTPLLEEQNAQES